MAEAKNKVKFGLSNFHYAVLDEAAGTYGKPVHVPGSVSLTAEPQGNETTFYADNMPYFQLTTNNGYSGDIELAIVPDSMLADLLGFVIDSNGMLVELSDALQKPCAVMAQIEGDARARKVVWFNCKIARPSNDASTTEDSVDVKTDAMSWVALPRVIGGKRVVKGVIEPTEANKAVYDAFFDDVLEPNFQ